MDNLNDKYSNFDQETVDYIKENAFEVFADLEELLSQYPAIKGQKMKVNKIYRPFFGRNAGTYKLIALQYLYNQLSSGKSLIELRSEFGVSAESISKEVGLIRKDLQGKIKD